MKTIFQFAFFTLVTTLVNCSSTKIGNKTPEDFASSLFFALKNKDVDQYTQLLPSIEDTKKSFEQLEFENEAEKQKMLNQMEDEGFQKAFKNELRNLKKEFENIIKYGEEIGINWEAAQLADFNYNIQKKRGLETLDGTIVLYSIKDKFIFNFHQCTHFNDGWLGAKFYGLKKINSP